MTDWAMSGRRDVYRFYAVDPFTLQEQEELLAEPSACSITWAYYTTNRVEADLVLVNDDYIKGGRDRLVRVKHLVTLPDGTQEQETLGTFFVDKAQRVSKDGVVRQKLTCYSTMWRLSQDYLADDFTYRKAHGSTPADKCEARIRRLIEYPGGTLVLGMGIDTNKSHTQDGCFMCGENRLEVLNEYCGWCNWVLDVDDDGRQVMSQYVAPSSRAISYEFEDGNGCVYLPEFDETYTGEVCNRVVVKWSRERVPSPDDGFGLSGKYVADLPTSSEYSFDRCGRYMTKVINLTSPTSASDMKATAEAYLAEHDAAIRYMTIEHVGIPHLRPGMVVRFTRNADTTNICEITQMEARRLGPLMITETKLKVIA